MVFGIKAFLHLFLYLEAAGFVLSDGALDPRLRLMSIDSAGAYEKTPLRDLPSVFSRHAVAAPTCRQTGPLPAHLRKLQCLSTHVTFSEHFSGKANALTSVAPWHHDLTVPLTQPSDLAAAQSVRRFGRLVVNGLVHGRATSAAMPDGASSGEVERVVSRLRRPLARSPGHARPVCNVTIATRTCVTADVDADADGPTSSAHAPFRNASLPRRAAWLEAHLSEVQSRLVVEGPTFDAHVHVVCLADLPLPEQLRRIAVTDVLVATSGSPLVHVLFLRPGSHAVEIAAGVEGGPVVRLYRNWAVLAGIRHRFLMPGTQPPTTMNHLNVALTDACGDRFPAPTTHI